MRTVVFSDPGVAKKMSETFVCAWVNKRPETKYENGLYQRLTAEEMKDYPLGSGVANITAIFALPDGTVLNAIPGYLDVSSFTNEMLFALDVFHRITDGGRRLRKDANDIYEKAHVEQAKLKHGPFATEIHYELAVNGPQPIDRIRYDAYDGLAPLGKCSK